MTNEDTPAISVVMATPYGFDSLRPLLGYLRAQTIRERIELVLVGTTPEECRIDASLLEGFHGHRILHVGAIEALNVPRDAGIRAARAPVVVLSEDHCFPAPTWAEALVRAHRGPWAAVGPTVGIANPQSYMSWANCLIQYGPWAPATPSGIRDDVPGHNSSYKRAVLLAYGDDLAAHLISESGLHADLRQRGHQLYMEGEAVTYHVYITKLWPNLRENYHIGRQFAANRSRGWGIARRWLYASLSPAIPALRSWRIFRHMRRLGWFEDLVPGILPALWSGLGAGALGEMAGYVFGMGRSASMTLDLDFHRYRFVTPEERRWIWSGENVAFPSDPPRPGRRRRGEPPPTITARA